MSILIGSEVSVMAVGKCACVESQKWWWVEVMPGLPRTQGLLVLKLFNFPQCGILFPLRKLALFSFNIKILLSHQTDDILTLL